MVGDLTFEEYKEFYEQRGFLPDDVSPRKNSLSDRQLKTRYNKYLKRREKQQRKIERKKEEIQNLQPTSETCLFERRLQWEGEVEHHRDLVENAGPLLDQVDRAHVIGRGRCPALKEDEENIVPLNRYSHSLLDQYKDPIYGTPISSEVHRAIWAFIVGERELENLEEKEKAANLKPIASKSKIM